MSPALLREATVLFVSATTPFEFVVFAVGVVVLVACCRSSLLLFGFNFIGSTYRSCSSATALNCLGGEFYNLRIHLRCFPFCKADPHPSLVCLFLGRPDGGNLVLCFYGVGCIPLIEIFNQ